MSTPLGRSSSARFMLLDVLVIGGAASFFADREIQVCLFFYFAPKNLNFFLLVLFSRRPGRAFQTVRRS
jgi:hypothetical protein